MINFRVRDLDAMMAQLKAAGIAVEPDPEPYPNGAVRPLARSGRQSNRIMATGGTRRALVRILGALWKGRVLGSRRRELGGKTRRNEGTALL